MHISPEYIHIYFDIKTLLETVPGIQPMLNKYLSNT